MPGAGWGGGQDGHRGWQVVMEPLVSQHAGGGVGGGGAGPCMHARLARRGWKAVCWLSLPSPACCAVLQELMTPTLGTSMSTESLQEEQASGPVLFLVALLPFSTCAMGLHNANFHTFSSEVS